jgi:hypothetical protein
VKAYNIFSNWSSCCRMGPFINQNFIYLSCHSMTFIRDYPIDFYNVHTSLVIHVSQQNWSINWNLHSSTSILDFVAKKSKDPTPNHPKTLIQINSRLTEIAIGFGNCSISLQFLFSLKIWKVVCYDLLTREIFRNKPLSWVFFHSSQYVWISCMEFLPFYKRSYGISNGEITFIQQIS